MSTQFVLDVPDGIASRMRLVAHREGRSVNDLVAATLIEAFSPFDLTEGPDMIELSDDEVLRLAQMRIPNEIQDRLSELLDRQQAGELAPGDANELTTLIEYVQDGQLRKADAMVEAIGRRIMEPSKS